MKATKIKINRNLEDIPNETINILYTIDELFEKNEHNTWLYGVEKKDIEILEKDVEVYRTVYLEVDEYTSIEQINYFRENLKNSKAYTSNANGYFDLEEIQEKINQGCLVAVERQGEIKDITEIKNNL